MDIPMELSRILITEMGEQQIIFLREKDGERNFPILIGTSEAMAIDRRLKRIQTPRPMTHDLLADVIEAMGGRLDKIVINDIHEHTFIAALHITQGKQEVVVDARPSDAIALGVAFDTPILVSEHVLKSIIEGPPTKQDRLDLLRQRMKMLAEGIEELEAKLADEDFISNAPEEIVAAHRAQLEEMTNEHDAIEKVLKKLG